MSEHDLEDELRRARFHERENYHRWKETDAALSALRGYLARLADWCETHRVSPTVADLRSLAGGSDETGASDS